MMEVGFSHGLGRQFSLPSKLAFDLGSERAPQRSAECSASSVVLTSRLISSPSFEQPRQPLCLPKPYFVKTASTMLTISLKIDPDSGGQFSE